MVEFAVYDRTRLAPGDELTGPVLIDEGTATTVVHSGQRVAVEEHGYLLVTAVGEMRTPARCERASASERAASSGLRGRGTQSA